jgi:hypothetical protein
MASSTGTVTEFSDLVAERTRDFTGRRWVFQAINDWLARPDGPRVFLLTGEPGSGKTALAARLVQLSRGETTADAGPSPPLSSVHSPLQPGFLSAFHFCSARFLRWIDPHIFIESLSATLAARYEPFARTLSEFASQDIRINATLTSRPLGKRGQITGMTIREIFTGLISARAAFDRLVRLPLESLCTSDFKTSIVLLVDGLDEALTRAADESLVTLLGRMADLPPQVRLIATTRPDLRVFRALGQPGLDLSTPPPGVDDVQEYVRQRLNVLPSLDAKAAADRVAETAQASFLHACFAVDDLLMDPGRVADLDRQKLPTGLRGLYHDFLYRELGRDVQRWHARYRPVLAALAVAEGPGLTRTQLAGLTCCSRVETSDVLRACGQYLRGLPPEGPFRLQPQSFCDFLLHKESEEFYVYPDMAHAAIADFFLNEYEGDWAICEDDYALRYTAAHLLEAARATYPRARNKLVAALTALLTDFGFLEARHARLSPNDLLVDIRTALDVLPPENAATSDLPALLRVLERAYPTLCRWDRASAPRLFAQQVHHHATALGATDLARRADAWLQGQSS